MAVSPLADSEITCPRRRWRHQLRQQVRQQVRNQLRQQVRQQVHNQLRQQVRNQLRQQVRSRSHHSPVAVQLEVTMIRGGLAV
jgi:hypothetical protein